MTHAAMQISHTPTRIAAIVLGFLATQAPNVTLATPYKTITYSYCQWVNSYHPTTHEIVDYKCQRKTAEISFKTKDEYDNYMYCSRDIIKDMLEENDWVYGSINHKCLE